MNQLNSTSQLSLKEWKKIDEARWKKVIIEEFERNKELSLKDFCDIFGFNRSTFWRWRTRYLEKNADGFIKNRFQRKWKRVTPEIEDKILELRKQHGWGHQRIQLYLKRYLNVFISSCTVWNVLKRNKMPNLYLTRYNKPAMRPMKRYEKNFPGETLQMDVKFVRDPNNRFKRFFQFTAIDDCTRYRVLRIYSRNNTQNAIDFLERVKECFPATIQQVQTDNGPEFATEFTFYLDQQGIHHRLIKPKTPRLNGKVERSHRTDEQEFYSKVNFINIADLQQKLSQWEKQYNHKRFHMSLNGQTPSEKLQSKLSTELIRPTVADKTD